MILGWVLLKPNCGYFAKYCWVHTICLTGILYILLGYLGNGRIDVLFLYLGSKLEIAVVGTHIRFRVVILLLVPVYVFFLAWSFIKILGSSVVQFEPC
ncbi:hypothetical protein M6B38_287875 [Iris pallida]|uniref:Uncharacterized protein n=1 Tax=Iris pallida TaxID=29817 RepID=A0AAX6HWF7_IRIPA|nr:hypothetical protein M6B38_287875 [Iris pallida]